MNVGDIATVAGAFGSAVVACGGVGKFVWTKIEKRFDRFETELGACRDRDAVKLTVIELLWQVVQANVPEHNVVLARAKVLLDGMNKS